MSTTFVVLFVCGLLAFLVVVIAVAMRPDKTTNWPQTEGTIHLVNQVQVDAGRDSRLVNVADFSYKVNGKYCSGRLSISATASTSDCSSRILVNQKVQVRYDPERPERFSLAQTEVAGFLLSPFSEAFGTDVNPIDLNLDKI